MLSIQLELDVSVLIFCEINLIEALIFGICGHGHELSSGWFVFSPADACGNFSSLVVIVVRSMCVCVCVVPLW